MARNFPETQTGVIDFPASCAPGFAEALAIYASHTDPAILTDPVMVTHWLDHPDAQDARRMHVLAYVLNGRVVGFCQAAVLTQARLIAVDYITVDPSARRGRQTFDGFFEGLQAFFHTHYPDHLPVFEAMALSGRALVRLLASRGFHPLPYPYPQPTLEAHADVPPRGCLMTWSPAGPMALSPEAYVALVDTLWQTHYLPWYAVYPEVDVPAYRGQLDALLTALMQEIGAAQRGTCPPLI